MYTYENMIGQESRWTLADSLLRSHAAFEFYASVHSAARLGEILVSWLDREGDDGAPQANFGIPDP
jgi:hypothetical protein